MRVLLALAATLILTGSALAFDVDTQAIADRYKVGKALKIADLKTLMSASERWCYSEEDGTCGWSDIYLEVDGDHVTFELGNAWNTDVDIAFVTEGEFRDNRYFCEVGEDWVPGVRAINRANGTLVGGRELFALKREIEEVVAGGSDDCFDYQFVSADAENQTITLSQRQFVDSEHDPDADTAVTIHFDKASAAALTWR